MAMIFVCDECGKPVKAVEKWTLGTGVVFLDGIESRQSVHLCRAHWPEQGQHQPHHCKRVRFHWPGKPEWNDEEAKPVEADYVAVDDCPAGRAIDMAVAKVVGLERLHWGDVRRGFGTAGYIRLEEEGKAYYLYTEADEIRPIPGYSTSRAAALGLVDALCAAGFDCTLKYLSYYGFYQIEMIGFVTGFKVFTIQADSEALAITRAYLKANGDIRVEKGPCGF